MVRDSVSKIKNGKAAGLLGLVPETVKMTGETGVDTITDLINQIIVEGVLPAEWELSTITNCYKRKGDALEKGNSMVLKLLDQILKIVERFIEKLIR